LTQQSAQASVALEQRIGQILRVGTLASSVCLAAGLLMVLAGYDTELSRLLLDTGVLTLLATPAGRVVVSVIEYIRERDWVFVLLTLIVLAALGASVLAALYF
jgi:uncharacterized membrane protein